MQQRLLTTVLIALLAASAAAVADSDTAKIRIVSGGSEEAVDIALDEMQVGESRQLVSVSGKPAIVTRTDTGVAIEVAGKRTEVAFPDPQEIAVHGDGKLHVVRLDGDHAGHDGDHARKVVVMRHRDTTDGPIDDEEIAALIAEVEAKHGLDHHDGDADGDKVIVTRKVVRERVD